MPGDSERRAQQARRRHAEKFVAIRHEVFRGERAGLLLVVVCSELASPSDNERLLHYTPKRLRQEVACLSNEGAYVFAPH